jgi:hypothetical protein
MSWTIYETDDGENSNSLLDLKTALQTAAARKILLYCAGQDKGEFEQHQGQGKPYPASCGIDRIKSIGSARTFGGKSEFVNLNNVDYLFPGEIEAVSGITTGSSAATALASGFAALVLWCAEAYQAEVKKRAVANKSKDGPVVMEDVDFRQDSRMSDLFDELKTVRDSKIPSLVNIMMLLKEAEKSNDRAAETLIKRCKTTVSNSFTKPASTTL